MKDRQPLRNILFHALPPHTNAVGKIQGSSRNLIEMYACSESYVDTKSRQKIVLSIYFKINMKGKQLGNIKFVVCYEFAFYLTRPVFSKRKKKGGGKKGKKILGYDLNLFSNIFPLRSSLSLALTSGLSEIMN